MLSVSVRLLSRYSEIVAKPLDQVYRSSTEALNPASVDLDSLSAVDLVRLMNREDAGLVASVGEQAAAIGAAIEAISDRLKRGGRLFYLGAGTSGRLGILDASECPPTFNTDPDLVQGLIAGGDPAIRSAVEGAEDDESLAVTDLRACSLRSEDCVVGIAASGTTPYVLAGVRYARGQHCLTIGISCNHGAPLAELTDHPLQLLVGPEVLAGSTRLKAGTATKMVLNMLSTGVMVRLGKTYGNLMVDLQATNEKLRARALGLLQRLTGLAEPEAAALMAKCGGELKTSIVSYRLSLAPELARARLAENDGVLRRSLSESS